MTAIPIANPIQLVEPKIAVLMTVFNGMHWINEQVDSILGPVGVQATVFISVDRSTDGSESWVDQKAQQDQRIQVLPHGLRFGEASLNFFRLLRELDFHTLDYISLADQDDIWLPEKLLRAHERLSKTGADAYSSDVMAFWENGKRVKIKKSQKQVKWDFLFEGAGPGCTYVLKPRLAQAIQILLKAQPSNTLKIEAYDWFIYAYARANGYVWLIDDYIGLLYRQHANNLVGANTGIKPLLYRFKKIMSGWGFSQVILTAHLAGLDNDPFVRQWSGGSRWGMFRLAMSARQCRRRLQHQLYFLVFCLGLAVKGVQFEPDRVGHSKPK